MKDGLCPDMPLYVNDWLSSMAVSMMTPAEEGAYFRLLCHAWNEPDCSLPDDDATLAKLSRLGDAWQQDSGARIRACFKPDPARPGRIFNERERKIRQRQQARLDAANARCEKMRKAKADKQAASCQASCKDNGKSLAKPLSSPVSRLSSLQQNTDTHTARDGAPGSLGRVPIYRAKSP